MSCKKDAASVHARAMFSLSGESSVGDATTLRRYDATSHVCKHSYFLVLREGGDEGQRVGRSGCFGCATRSGTQGRLSVSFSLKPG